MNTSTVVSLDQIRAVLESNTTNAHAEVMALLEKPLLAETLIKHVATRLRQPNYLA